MRFSVELLLEKDTIPKDKNRIMLSIIKSCIQSCYKEYYEELYETSQNRIKDFCFSLYMPEAKFLREEIVIPYKKIILNFSAYKPKDGLMVFNSILGNRGKEFPIKNNSITIKKVSLRKEKDIFTNEVIFRALSPIVVREHKGNNKKTWYHSLNSKEGQEVFLSNLKHQLEDVFGEMGLLDSQEISIELSKNNKEVKVKNYGIEVLSNIAKIRIKAKPYILNYLYKAGIGSKRGSGFGMLEIVEKSA